MTTQALRTLSERDYQAICATLAAQRDDLDALAQSIAAYEQAAARPVHVNPGALLGTISRASNYLPLIVITFLVGCIAGLLLAKLATIIVAGFVAGVVLALGFIVGYRP